MNEEQRAIVTKEFESYNRMAFHDWLHEYVSMALYELQDAGQVDEEADRNARNKLGLETEQVFCEAMIHRLQQHLQTMPKAFPNWFPNKRLFVEIEYNEDEVITVSKVTVNGDEVIQPYSDDDYWPVVHGIGSYLDLQISHA